MGSTLAAFLAGYTPKNNPTIIENIIEKIIAPNEIEKGQFKS